MWEVTQEKHRIKKKETKLIENNIYNDAWKNFKNFAFDQTV